VNAKDSFSQKNISFDSLTDFATLLSVANLSQAESDKVLTFASDPQNWFNTETSRFQPTIAGYYNITYVAWFQGGVVGSGQQFNTQIRKNENSIAISQQPESSNTVGQSLIVSDKVYLNGSSDYLTFTAYSSAGTVSLAAGNGTYFTAELSGVSALANATLSLAQSAYNQANSAYELANSAYNRSNSSNVLVKSEVTSIVAGSELAINVTYANTMYPGGIFTITQQLPISLTMTNIWSSGLANKNAYINLESNLVNTQNITVNLALSQTDFNIQSSDFIRIGSSTVTGANLISLGISGNGGSYIIPSSFFTSNIQTNSSSTVSANLSTSRGFANTNGTTLTNTQATRFAVNSLTGNWPAATVPYFNLNQSFSWSASVTGTVSSGNVTYSGASSGSLTTTGATSGSSGSLNSNSSYSISSSDYRGAGLNGAGTRTIPSTVSSNITPATIYYPLFYKVTGSSANPNFTTSDTYITSNYVLGQGANTTANESDYLWIAIPGSSSHEFAFTFLNTEVVATPAVTYTGQTISGQTYNVYGFTNYSAVTYIYTTS
jgi:hypothetical protein